MPKKNQVTRAKKKQMLHVRHFHALRLSCFGILLLGLMTVQAVSYVHTTTVAKGEVLAYASGITVGDLLAATNESRAANGLATLSLNGQLNSGAQAKANDMIAKNYWSHTAPDGTEPWAFFKAAGYKYAKAGENLAYGFDTSTQVQTAWMNSAGHKANVLGTYSEVGFGIANGASYQGGEQTVVVAFYGLPAAAPATQAAPTPPAPKPIVSTPAPAPAPVAETPPAPTLEPTPEPVVQEPIKEPAVAAAPAAKRVTNFDALFGGHADWALYASLGVIGVTSVGFAGTHWQLVRRGWKVSRHYILVHPALDTAIIAAIAATVFTSAAGFVL